MKKCSGKMGKGSAKKMDKSTKPKAKMGDTAMTKKDSGKMKGGKKGS